MIFGNGETKIVTGDWFFASFAFIAFIAFIASEIEIRESGSGKRR